MGEPISRDRPWLRGLMSRDRWRALVEAMFGIHGADVRSVSRGLKQTIGHRPPGYQRYRLAVIPHSRQLTETHESHGKQEVSARPGRGNSALRLPHVFRQELSNGEAQCCQILHICPKFNNSYFANILTPGHQRKGHFKSSQTWGSGKMASANMQLTC